MRREPKKSDTLEVRLAHEAKQAFMAKAADEGQSASEVVRNLVAHYLDASTASAVRASKPENLDRHAGVVVRRGRPLPRTQDVFGVIRVDLEEVDRKSVV